MKTIAETAWHHQGDSTFYQDLVRVLSSQTRSDFVKLHVTLDLDEYMHSNHHAYEILKPMVMGKEVYESSIESIKQHGKKLMLLYNDTKAVEFGQEYNPEIAELHATCLSDFHLLNALKSNITSQTTIALGIGGSSLYEIERAMDILQHNKILLMFGFQNYPTCFEDINFQKMRKIMRLYPDFDFGYADHTGWNHEHNELITLLGAATGMRYIEKHVTTRYGEERIDSSAAISVAMWNDLIEKLKILEACDGNGMLALNKGESAYAELGPMKKAATLANAAKAGDKLSWEMISFKRTKESTDILPTEISGLCGSIFAKDLSAGAVLRKSDIKVL